MDPTISFYFGDKTLELNFPSGFTLFGWRFHFYGLIIAIGFLLAVIYTMRRRKYFGIHDDSILDMLLFGVPLGIIGARVYYLIFSAQPWSDNLGQNIMHSLQIWNGGLAIYGGVIGAGLGIILFGIWQRRKLRKLGKAFKLAPYFDLAALGFLIGQSIGRWGNFTNRECFGGETTLPWRMGLTFDGITRNYHPAFLYESLWNAVGFVLLHLYSKRRKYDGEIFVLYLGWYGLGRAWIEGLRTDSLYILGTGLRVSQLLALGCVLVSLVLEIYFRIIRTPDEDNLYANRIEFTPINTLENSLNSEADYDSELEAIIDEIEEDNK